MWWGPLTFALLTLCLLVSLPVLVLFLQVLLAHCERRRAPAPTPTRHANADLAVLIPAHNEAGGIAATLQNLRAQLRDGDRVLVVADNCNDDTAALARQAGADVIERSDAVQRGKGFALDFGVRYLSTRPPTMVLIVDADCLLDDDALNMLASLCSSNGRPVQALYEMNAPKGSGLRARVSAFAWRVRNRVRPLGWWVVGAPCQLMGTGMMFPWALLRDAPLASGHIAEDVQLGADLALRGWPPLFAPQARVTSEFPAADDAAASQRRRWEHGNLSLMVAHGPRLIAAGLRRADAGLLAMAADMMVPPLALLVQLLLGLVLLGMLAWWLGAPLLPLIISAAALALLVLSILAAWRLAGRDVIALSELLVTAPAYALRKLPMYAAFLWKRQSTWVRAKREGE